MGAVNWTTQRPHARDRPQESHPIGVDGRQISAHDAKLQTLALAPSWVHPSTGSCTSMVNTVDP